MTGEIAIVTVFDDDHGTATTHVRRYLPPYLLPGTLGGDPLDLQIDFANVTVRYPVVGIIRGVASAA